MAAISKEQTKTFSISAKKRRQWVEWLSGYAFLAPSFIVLAVFTYFPVLYALGLSFFRWRIMRGEPTFNGLTNYQLLLTSEDFWQAIGNTIYFALGSIPTGMAVALFIAILLNRPMKLLPIYRTAFFLPTVTSMVAVSVVWMWIYHPDVGLMNYFLNLVGLPSIRWLNDPRWAMPALILLGVWKGLGYNVIIYLAGLQNIPEQLYEAAQIDGANRWQLFRHVTWPLLTPTTFLILIMAVINSFQAFTEFNVMTQGGPLGATTVVVYYLYQQAFQQFNMGYGSALAIVLFLIVLGLTLVQNKILGPRVHYQ
ncbi:MAG: sugar ABC transporter permease [Chloroflexi bacterium]|nr:sugar ABC transporter permease [Chloroflexota bacterium]